MANKLVIKQWCMSVRLAKHNCYQHFQLQKLKPRDHKSIYEFLTCKKIQTKKCRLWNHYWLLQVSSFVSSSLKPITFFEFAKEKLQRKKTVGLDTQCWNSNSKKLSKHLYICWNPFAREQWVSTQTLSLKPNSVPFCNGNNVR